MAEQDRCEVRVAPGSEHGDAVSHCPEHDPGDPLLEPKPHRGGDRSVDDGDAARRSPKQQRRTEADVDRRFESGDVLAHAISAPPPKLKKPLGMMYCQ